ncbi:formate dehydrogenase accessory protein FdhE [Cytobacillus dafuensis]|uniref:Formate dehydrogenase accessory protein FdhE n=1 Tax=Cytobacillus dafuensis TaxID=1742359 RepID=A0A5B8ZC27_CYTDA|nr:formate dehydrogenase accessory protein FdhE [Cytobacillus dafuensis]QED49783.1 formate dehydrogenase accessory protein FdhE [Cytobacillus dafuensis]
MAKINVLDSEYEKLQKDIQALNDKWSEQCSDIIINGIEKIKDMKAPYLSQLELAIDFHQYRSFIEELLALISCNKSELKISADKAISLLNDDVLQRWFKEAIAVNDIYFKKFAEENDLPEWLPMFAAEHAVRPYLQKAAEKLKDKLKKSDHNHGCPSCGEPARFAIIDKSGKKELTCPRCLHSWEEKKISCAHCGTEGDLVIIKIEEEESAEIHACHKCKGYTKVIDVRQMFKKESPTLLDIKSIHLDYIAQEKGFGIPEVTGAH